MKRPLLTIGPVLLCLVLVSCQQAEEAKVERALTVDLIAPELQSSYEVREFALATVEAARRSDLGFEIPGTLDEVLKEEGDRVEQGEALARLNTERLDARHLEAEASLAQAKALLTLARATLARNESARSSGAISAQQLDQAIQQHETAKASVKRAEAELERVEVDLRRSILRAPYDGIVARRSQDPGSAVAVGQLILQLLESQQLEIRAGLPAQAVGKVGNSVELYRGGRPTGTATIRRILPALNAAVRTVDVILQPDSRIPQLRDGDLVEVAVERRIPGDGFWLPLSALGESHRGLWAGFLASQDDSGELRAERLNLEILHLEEERAFVRAPLTSEARLIAHGLHRLVPGQKIEASETPQLYTTSIR